MTFQINNLLLNLHPCQQSVPTLISPEKLNELLNDPDKEKVGRVTQAILQMKKIIVADLEKA